jgi:hypothetical protein
LDEFKVGLEGLVGPLVHYEVVVKSAPPPRPISGVKIQAENSKPGLSNPGKIILPAPITGDRPASGVSSGD